MKLKGDKIRFILGPLCSLCPSILHCQEQKKNFNIGVIWKHNVVISDFDRVIQRLSFWGGWVGKSRSVFPGSIFPFLASLDSKSDVVNKSHDIKNWVFCFNWKAMKWRFHGKLKQLDLKKYEFEYWGVSTLMEICGCSSPWKVDCTGKIYDFYRIIPIQVETSRLSKKSNKSFQNNMSMKIEIVPYWKQVWQFWTFKIAM